MQKINSGSRACSERKKSRLIIDKHEINQPQEISVTTQTLRKENCHSEKPSIEVLVPVERKPGIWNRVEVEGPLWLFSPKKPL